MHALVHGSHVDHHSGSRFIPTPSAGSMVSSYSAIAMRGVVGLWMAVNASPRIVVKSIALGLNDTCGPVACETCLEERICIYIARLDSHCFMSCGDCCRDIYSGGPPAVSSVAIAGYFSTDHDGNCQS